jgi:cytoskeletal protein RodZ
MAAAELLRREREHRGLTLEQVAVETKIPLARLAAFESGGLSLDADFYQRAQIRAYARALSLDERHFTDELRGDVIAAAPPVAQKPRTALAVSGLRSPVALAGCGIIVGAVVAVGLMNRESQPRGTAETSRPVPAVAELRERQAVATEASVLPASMATVGTIEAAPARAATPASERRADIVTPRRTATVPQAPAAIETPTPVVAPGVTQLVITSQPAGARVTVDGIGWGVTPITIRHLPEGVKRIRVTSTGYAAAERVVRVEAEHTSNVAIQLKPVPLPGQSAP